MTVLSRATLADRRQALGLVAIHALSLLFVVSVTVRSPGMKALRTQDVSLYYEYGLKIVQGQLPYRDFTPEYPPLALVPMVLPALACMSAASPYSPYIYCFAGQNLLLSVLVMLVMIATLRRAEPDRPLTPAIALYALTALILSPLILWHYDVLPALFTMVALWAVVARHPVFTGVALGLGIAAKLYAAAFLPVLCIYYTVTRDWRALWLSFLSCSIVVGLAVLPFVIQNGNGVAGSLQYHVLRGLELESIPAGIIGLLHVVGLTEAAVHYSYGAWHIASPLSRHVVAVLPFLFLLCLAVVTLRCLRHFREAYRSEGDVGLQGLITYLLVSLLLFVVFNKVLSPQYLLWLLPLGVLVSRLDRRTLPLISLLTMVLITPWMFHLLIQQRVGALMVLNLRNCLLMALLFWLVNTAGRRPSTPSRQADAG